MDEPRNVEPGRALGRARRDALSGVIREQKFQRHLARRADVLALGDHYHALRDGHAAGGRERAAAFDLDRAEEAPRSRLDSGHVAHGRDADAEPLGRLETVVPGGTPICRPSIVKLTMARL